MPINAVFWVLATGGAMPTASLDGAPLSVGSRGELQPGTLLPEHDYKLLLKYPRRDEWEPELRMEIKFRTGRRAARAPGLPPAPRVTRSRQVPIRLTRIVAAQGCHDTKQDTLLSFHVPGKTAAYLIEGHLWPAEYGAPSLFVHAQFAARLCVELVPIGTGGQLGRARRVCARKRAA